MASPALECSIAGEIGTFPAKGSTCQRSIVSTYCVIVGWATAKNNLYLGIAERANNLHVKPSRSVIAVTWLAQSGSFPSS